MGDTPIYTLVQSSCPRARSLVDYATPTGSNTTRFNALERLMPAVGALKSLRLFTDEGWAGKGYDTSLMSTEVHTRFFHCHEQGVWLLKPKVLQYSTTEMGRKLDWKRGARLRPHMNNLVPQEHQFSVGHRKPTGSPQPIPKLSHGHTAHTFNKVTVQHRP